MSGNVVVTTVAPEAARRVCRIVQFGQGATEIRAGTRHVVHPDAHGDQIRLQRQRRGKLLIEQVFDPPAADGQVGVRHAGVVGVDHRGEAIGEADETYRVVAVPQPFCLAIADRDISGVPRHTGTLTAKRRFDIRCSGVRRKFTVALGHLGAAGAQDIDYLDDLRRRGTR